MGQRAKVIIVRIGMVHIGVAITMVSPQVSLYNTPRVTMNHICKFTLLR